MSEDESRLFSVTTSRPVKYADLRGAGDLDGNLAPLVSKQYHTTGVFRGDVDLSRKSSRGNDGNASPDRIPLPFVDDRSFPPSGWLPFYHPGSNNVQPGLFLEIEGASQFRIFSFEFTQSAFNRTEFDILLLNGAKLVLQILGVLDFLKKSAGVAFDRRSTL